MNYQYDNTLFNFQVTRKHFFRDKNYQLYLFYDELIMTDNIQKPPKYVIKINLTTTLRWVVQNKKIVAFEFFYRNNYKAVHGPPTKMQLLKEMIAGKVFYQPLNLFYTLQMELGRGMTGSVSRCIYNETQEYYAVKIIEKSKIVQHEGGISQLIHELSLLGTLSHHNIVKLKEVYTDVQHYYIVTEYINGRTLSSVLQSRQNGLPVSESIKIMGDILEAVVYIHDKGIMHRDLNPLNIMQGQDGVKLIDFGLARRIKNTLIFPTSGTPGYMAPEIINFQKVYDEKADVYSLGCVMYKLLTGEHLFGKGKGSLFQSNKDGQFELKKQANHPEVNSNKMEQLFVLMHYMLENDPANRLSAKICLNLLNEIENNNSQIDKLIKKIKSRKQLTVTQEETLKDKPKSTEIYKEKQQYLKSTTKQSMDFGYRKSIDEMSVLTQKKKLQNQQQVLLVQPNISYRSKKGA